MPELNVTAVDLAVLIGYVVGTRILFGWYFARQTEGKSENYFLAGRKLRWPLIGLSFYVSNMSGSSFVGLPGSGYSDGVAVYNYEWLPSIILIFFVFFILPFYLRAEVFTAPQFLEKRYDSRAKLAYSGFLLFANIFVDAAAALYAGATVMQTLYPAFPVWGTIAITALIAGVYIFFGGLGAVVINDTLQAAVIMLGGTAVAVLAWMQIPSWEAVSKAAAPGAMHLIQPADDEVLPWPGIFSGILVIGIYFWCTNQFVIQRALGAESLDQGRWGALFAGVLKLPNLFILVLPGVMAAQLYPDLENPDLVFPTMAFDVLPIGLRGLMLAALAAAILSSLEAIFNSASTLLTMDFVRGLRPKTSDRALVNIGRASTLGFMLLAALWTPQITRFPTLWQYLQSILSYLTPPVVVVFLAGIFSRRANAAGALATLAAGIPLGVAAWAAVEVFRLVPLPFLYASGIMLLVSAVLMLLGSLVTAPPELAEIEQLTWQRSIWRDESRELAGKPWYANYRYLSAILLVVTLAIVIWWW